MRMIHKSYACFVPNSPLGDFTVHAWMAPGSKSVNLRVEADGEFLMVDVHYLNRYRNTMDELIDWLYYVKA